MCTITKTKKKEKMAKWKIIQGEAGDKCVSSRKDLKGRKAYIKKPSSLLKSLVWRGSAYCSQSCFNSDN